MAALKSTVVLKPVEAAEVMQWFKDAWPDRSQYPDDRSCHRVAMQVNTIVNRHNAVSIKGTADQRQDYLVARTRARALNQELQRTMENLRNEQYLSTVEGLVSIDRGLANRIAVTARALTAVESFLGLPEPPKVEDHLDPVLWIELAAREAWSGLADASDGKSNVTFGRKPDGPLVHFIRLALEAIGMAGCDQPGYSLDTISERLRKRQNRPRPNRGNRSRVGEN